MKKSLILNLFPIRTLRELFFWGSLALFVSSCDQSKVRFGKDRAFPGLNYTGDGELTDHGSKSGIFRFVLDLGQVNLKEAVAELHELKGLPQVEFVCYLRVDHPLAVTGRAKGEFQAGGLVVEMTLTDQDGNEIFTESASLNRWTWSGSVGALQSDLYTAKTIFTPQEGKSYKISLKAPKGNPEAPTGRLLLMGGGWKAFN
ncbi:MAG: hypothetical protein GY899_08205 [Verrucomicrobiaceae bacterium]|nr:hypothetical protein [Verrucomicrobiaceae bacterium]